MHLIYGCNEIVHADVALKSIKIKCITSMPVLLMFLPCNWRWCLKRWWAPCITSPFFCGHCLAVQGIIIKPNPTAKSPSDPAQIKLKIVQIAQKLG